MRRGCRVCFVQLPHSCPGGMREPSVFPVGIASLAAVLRPLGHEVKVLDGWADPSLPERMPALIRNMEPTVVGISALTTQFAQVKRLTAAIKSAMPVPIVLGGAGPTLSPEVFLAGTSADYCVIGEGEVTLPDLLEKMEAPDEVPGIAYKAREGQIAINRPRPYLADLDSLPFPEYGVFDMEPYLRSTKVKHRQERAHTVITGRGCPYDCGFCSRHFTGARYRSSEHVLAEVDYLERKLGKAQVAFSDELLLLPRRRAEAIADGLRSRRLIWNCQGRVNLVDRELLAHLWVSGCRTIGYGIESGSNRILRRMDKRITSTQIREALTETLRQGFTILIQLIFGYPGEDDESLSETRALFADLQLPAFFSILTPLPGSPVYQEARGRGLIPDEAAYFSRLDHGYLADGRVVVNMTEWSDTEFHQRKARLEAEINEIAAGGAYQRSRSLRHPTLYARRFGAGAWARMAARAGIDRLVEATTSALGRGRPT